MHYLKIKNYKIKNYARRGGFSIIEVIFSVFVIAVGLTAVLSVLAKSILNSIDSRNTIIASQLAQEGIELVRNIRDNNWVNSNPAFYNVSFPNNDNGACRIDYSTIALVDSTNCKNSFTDNDYSLYIAGNFYKHDNTGTKTKYMRKIIIIYQDDNGGTTGINRSNATRAKVVSMVTWNGLMSYDDATYKNNCYILNKCVYIEDILTTWN